MTAAKPLIRKPSVAASCRHWGGQPKEGRIPSNGCMHSMLPMRMREWSCAQVRMGGFCPYGRELEVSR